MARDLFRNRKYPYCLFFCHLAVEKMIKAVVVAKLHAHAPWTHNLPFLAGHAAMTLDKGDLEFLVELTRWNLEARYPSDLLTLKKKADASTVRVLIKKTNKFLKWLKNQLQKNY